MNHDTDPRLRARFEDTLPGVGGRRSDERVALHARVHVLPLDGRRGPLWGATEDISHRGVFVRTSVALPVECLVVLRIYSTEARLSLMARVVHSIEDVGFGCEFVDVKDDQRVTLSGLVAAKASAPLPKRAVH